MTLSKSSPRAKPRWLALSVSVAAMLLIFATAALASHSEVSLTGSNRLRPGSHHV